MKGSTFKRLTWILAASLWSGGAMAGHGDAHWGYEGKTGPDHWASLAAEFGTCGTGQNQSPVDLSRIVEAEQPPVTFHYDSTPLTVTNNGHSVQVDYAPGSYIEVGNHRFELKQFHFHSPSEHEVAGHDYPMEGHLVHADEKGNLAVIGVLYEEGGENEVIRSVWDHMPTEAGHEEMIDGVMVNADGLLPEARSFYRYNGSLTTPPCTEGVTWMVMKQPVRVSRQEVEQFHALMGVDNNRPVQPLNARLVIE